MSSSIRQAVEPMRSASNCTAEIEGVMSTSNSLSYRLATRMSWGTWICQGARSSRTTSKASWSSQQSRQSGRCSSVASSASGALFVALQSRCGSAFWSAWYTELGQTSQIATQPVGVDGISAAAAQVGDAPGAQLQQQSGSFHTPHRAGRCRPGESPVVDAGRWPQKAHRTDSTVDAGVIRRGWERMTHHQLYELASWRSSWSVSVSLT